MRAALGYRVYRCIERVKITRMKPTQKTAQASNADDEGL